MTKLFMVHTCLECPHYLPWFEVPDRIREINELTTRDMCDLSDLRFNFDGVIPEFCKLKDYND
jgi:hypothetical protein